MIFSITKNSYIRQKLQRRIYYLLIFLCIFLLNNTRNNLYSQISRIQGMGNLFLVTEDEDNELNLFDYGKNSAFLIHDASKDWLKVQVNASSENGSLHRLYDPNGKDIYSINFNALKIIDENQTFRGEISYTNYRKKDTYRTIQTDPYAGSIFMLFDTTTGSIDFNGPAIEFEYSANLFQDATFGAKVNYTAQSGVKNVYSKPEITNRYISGQVAFAYALIDNVYVSAKIDPFFNFEKITLITDDDTGTNPTTYRYRGFNIYRVIADDYPRYNKNYGFKTDFQSSYKSSDSLINIFFTGGYQFQDMLVEEQFSVLEEEGYWQEDGYNANLYARIIPDFISKNLTVGLSFEWRNLKAWAKHPDLPILFNENESTRTSLGIGLSYYCKDIGLRCGFEYHRTTIDTVLKDYIGDEYFSDSYPFSEFRVGAELELSDLISIRAGFNYSQSEYNHTDVLPNIDLSKIEYSRNYYTLGMSYLVPDFVKIELLGIYGLRSSSDLTPAIDYKSAGLILSTKFLVF
jgi:hypothetical protein